jgi:D-sedoheptulose 7-phosphate isomerase
VSFPKNKKQTLEQFKSAYTKILFESLENIDSNALQLCFEKLLQGIQNGVNIFSCGNGGSSAIAEHLVCDFVKQASTESIIKPKVFSLQSTPIVTAIANDIGYDEIFSYQLERYAKPDDILISISSSGNSENIYKVIKQAKAMGVFSISFVGFEGGRAIEMSDISLHIKADNYGVIEDAHHSLMHIFSQYLRLQSFKNTKDLENTKF